VALAAEVNNGSYNSIAEVTATLAKRWHPAEAAINNKYDHHPIGTAQDVADIKLSCRKLLTAIMDEDAESFEACVRWPQDIKPELRQAMSAELFARHRAGSAATAAFGRQATQLHGLLFDADLESELKELGDGFMDWINSDYGKLMSADRRRERDYHRTPEGWKTDYLRPESDTAAEIDRVTRRTKKFNEFEQHIMSGMYSSVVEANDALAHVLQAESLKPADTSVASPPEK
jgi:hypothetical protein